MSQCEEVREKQLYSSTDLASVDPKLRDTADYQNLIKTINLLQQQQMQAIRDIQELTARRDASLSDPVGFIKALQQKGSLHLPRRQHVCYVPLIDIAKYRYPSAAATSYNEMRTRRTRMQSSDDDVGEVSLPGRKPKLNEGVTTRLWTPEEQKRLEELLLMYPPEPVAIHRWTKIAKALGNRTPQQVASRTQKYFIKLAKAGLPVPGKPPNLEYYLPKKPVREPKGMAAEKHGNDGAHTANGKDAGSEPKEAGGGGKPATDGDLTATTPDAAGKGGADNRLPYYVPPPADVMMADDREEGEGVDRRVRAKEGTAGDAGQDQVMQALLDKDPSLQHSELYKEWQMLRKLKSRALASDSTVAALHYGFRCDVCGCEPIVGVRWKCVDCPPEYCTDLCGQCAGQKFASEHHSPSHQFVQVMTPEPPGTDWEDPAGDYDDDLDDVNYLDPLYMLE